MPKAVYIRPGDERHEVDVPVGHNLMRAACDHGIEGIIGDCGGAMTCATCHVYVEEGLDLLPLPGESEDQMLDFTAAPRRPNSRLSCQLIATDMQGEIVIRVPAEQ